jgi:epoxide hydrolase-like predicted phosphatase
MRGLLVDYGGVLTSSVFGSFEAFCRSEGLDPAHVGNLFRSDPRARELLVEMETGRMDETEFETEFAKLLELEAPGLIDRLFAGMKPETEVIEAVAAARRAGLTTGLLSNSWGKATRYDHPLMDGLFDASVISAEVGMRKPDPPIYELAAERMGLPPQEIVFVDDLPFNLKPARELGMATVHHTDPATTIAELESILGIRLR